MTVKQIAGSAVAPDGSTYVVLTDGAGNLGSSITATSTENLSQLNGATIDTNSGNKSAGTQRVVIATDQPSLTNGLTVSSAQSTVGTITSVASSATDVTILASNANRKGAAIYNDSTQVLYLACASATSSTSVYTVQIAAGGFFELPLGNGIYTGVLKGIWASANGNARVTEWT